MIMKNRTKTGVAEELCPDQGFSSLQAWTIKNKPKEFIILRLNKVVLVLAGRCRKLIVLS